MTYSRASVERYSSASRSATTLGETIACVGKGYLRRAPQASIHHRNSRLQYSAAIMLCRCSSIERSRYQPGSSTTRDYRAGKSGDVAALLRGDPIGGERHGGYDPSWAIVIVTAPELLEHDTDALVDWGLTPDLADALAPATWIHVPRAAGRIAEREIRARIDPLVRLYARVGYALDV